SVHNLQSKAVFDGLCVPFIPNPIMLTLRIMCYVLLFLCMDFLLWGITCQTCSEGVSCNVYVSNSTFQTIDCPKEDICNVTCTNLDSCANGNITCPINTTCTITGPFKNVTIQCPEYGSCNILGESDYAFQYSTVNCPTRKGWTCNLTGRDYFFDNGKIKTS